MGRRKAIERLTRAQRKQATAALQHACEELSGSQGPGSDSQKSSNRLGFVLQSLLVDAKYHDEHLEACLALSKLLTERARMLDVAEFMFDCTSGIAMGQALLDRSGFTRTRLRYLGRKLLELSQELEKLLHHRIPGPTAYASLLWGPAGEDWVKHGMALPTELRTWGTMLEIWPEYLKHKMPYRKTGAHYDIAYFLVFLKNYKCGLKELSALLKLILAARLRCEPNAQSELDNNSATALLKYPFLLYAKQYRKGKLVDPLSVEALGRALTRYWQRNVGLKERAVSHLHQYLTYLQKSRSKRPETFLEYYGRL